MSKNITSYFDTESKRWEVTLQGEFDIFNANDLKTGLLDLTNKTNADLCIDCGSLDYLDSTAIGALVSVLKNVRNYDGKIILRQVKPNLAKLFKITKLDKVFEIEGDAHA